MLWLTLVATVAAGAVAVASSAGPSGALGKEIVRAASPNDSSTSKAVHAECPKDKIAVGGGFQKFGVVDASVVTDSRPSLDREGWFVMAVEAGAYPDAWQIVAWVVCIYG